LSLPLPVPPFSLSPLPLPHTFAGSDSDWHGSENAGTALPETQGRGQDLQVWALVMENGEMVYITVQCVHSLDTVSLAILTFLKQ